MRRKNLILVVFIVIFADIFYGGAIMAISGPQPVNAKYPASVAPAGAAANDPASQKLTGEQNAFWSNYQNNFLRQLPKGIIVVDKYITILGDGGAAVSEGMGHAMIFAAERGDWKTFDGLRAGLKAYFTNANGLNKWVIRPDGAFSVNDERMKKLNGLASASETEQNVAFALLVAYEKTKNPIYKNEALKLLGDIWSSEVVSFQGRTLLLPADITNNIYFPIYKENGKIVSLSWNPAYFSPMLYKKFARYDQSHNWIKLVNDGYSLMDQMLRETSKDREGFGIAGINPMTNWIRLKAANNGGLKLESVYPNPDDPYSTQYSNEWDTIRIPIYVGWDSKDKRSGEFLRRFYAATSIKSPEDVTINGATGKGIRSDMATAAYAAGLKCIGRDVSAFTRGIEIGRTDLYYQESITYHAWLLLNDRTPK